MPSVSGQIIWPKEAAFENATVFVRVEDVSLMGAPARTVASQRLDHVDASRTPLTFDLSVQDVDERNRYRVTAHVSLDGSQDFASGDYITKETHFVLTHGQPASANLHLSRV